MPPIGSLFGAQTIPPVKTTQRRISQPLTQFPIDISSRYDSSRRPLGLQACFGLE